MNEDAKDEEFKEFLLQKAIADAIRNSPRWPVGAEVIVQKVGDVLSQIETALGMLDLCALVCEPDDMQGVYGASSFIESSKWRISVFSAPSMNATGISNLAAALLIRKILGETNPGNLFAEPISRGHIRLVGKSSDQEVARDITFTAAYQA